MINTFTPTLHCLLRRGSSLPLPVASLYLSSSSKKMVQRERLALPLARPPTNPSLSPPTTGRVRDLLASNGSPDEMELAYLRRQLSDSSIRTAQLSTEILALQLALSDLEERHDRHFHKVEECKALLHPIRRLPRELLQEIFRRCMCFDDHFDSVKENASVPWLLSQVCRSWRDAAIGFPVLWSLLVISLPEADSPKPSSPRLHIQLSRSSECLLKVGIHLGPASLDVAEIFIPNILSSSHRWEALKLKVPREAMHILHPIGGTLHSLRWLSISFPNEQVLSVEPLRPSFSTLFDATSNLKRLETYSVNEHLQLPWENLIQRGFQSRGGLALNSCFSSDMEHTNLVQLSLKFRRAITMPSSAVHTLPNLTILVVKVADHESLSMLWRSMTLPQLTKLILFSPHPFGGTEEGKKHMVDFFRRSECPLSHLTLRLPSETPSTHLIDFFRCTPMMTQLYLSLGTSLPEDLVQHLTYSPEDSDKRLLLPILTNFHWSSPLTIVDYAALSKIFQSREVLPNSGDLRRLRQIDTTVGFDGDASQSAPGKVLFKRSGGRGTGHAKLFVPAYHLPGSITSPPTSGTQAGSSPLRSASVVGAVQG